jgi:uncharacterized membrane protein YgcG
MYYFLSVWQYVYLPRSISYSLTHSLTRILTCFPHPQQIAFRVYTEALWYPGRQFNLINAKQQIPRKSMGDIAAAAAAATASGGGGGGGSASGGGGGLAGTGGGGTPIKSNGCVPVSMHACGVDDDDVHIHTVT